MFMEKKYTIISLGLTLSEDGIKINVGGEHKLFLEIKEPNSDEIKIGHTFTNPFCSIRGEFTPNTKVKDAFVALSQNLVPMGSYDPSDDCWKHYLDDQTGKIKEKHILSMRMLPPSFQDFCRKAQNELYNMVRQTVFLIRWRKGLDGEHNPLRVVSERWSFDGIEWHTLPSDFLVEMSGGSCPHITPREINEIKELLGQYEEPIYHNIFREAQVAMRINPRSALILGVTAVEVSVKILIGELVPDAQWLIEHIPSPPIVDMLENYLPNLPVRLKINGKARLPESMIAEMKKAIQMRNKLVHTGYSPNRQDIKDKLLVIKNLLWLIDYYRGYGWALEYISNDYKLELGIHSN